MKYRTAVFGIVLFGWAASLPAPAADETASPKPANTYYTIGPDDEVTISVVELPEFSARSYHIDADGTVGLPLIGRVVAGGLTAGQFEDSLCAKLRSQVKNPHVTVGLVSTKSLPVSVMGAVNNPGTQQLQGEKTLFDVLAAAGGLKTDAGPIITITRQPDQGSLSILGSTTDKVSGKTTAEVRVHDVVDLRDPHSNIIVHPHDQISVGRAKLLYVIGDVKKAGGFTLNERTSISVLEALSLAEGLSPNARPSGARILRKSDSSSTARVGIPVDLKKVLAGKAEDVQITADDILFVPDNSSRRMAGKVAETALATLSGVVIWHGL